MPVQENYKTGMDAGRVGAIANSESKTLISRSVEGVALGFGLPVAQGDTDLSVHKAKTGDTVILGVSVRERSMVAETDEHPVGGTVRVMTKGVIWVSVSADVVAGDPVHVVVASATFTKAGGVEIANARYESSAVSGELAKVRLG